MTTAEAVILAVIEGITEYLPVSSTGHMILTEAFLKMQKSTFTNLYIVNIQFGAILSVLFIYWKRFFQSFDFYLKLAVAFIPAAVLGFLLNDFIDSLLSSVVVVAVSLIVGGIILLLTDKIFEKQLKVSEANNDVAEPFVGWMQGFLIGCFQCVAMIPGVSRSAATIVGGLQQGLNIKKAAEFSFFLAVPTIAAASLYKLIKGYSYIKGTDMDLLLIGNAVSFIVGMIAIKFFIQLITRYGLKIFGYYRILLGAFILLMLALGYNLEITD